MVAKPTKTINRLHFSDLDPLRFEDLCLEIIERVSIWKELYHLGRKGNDGGIDIYGIENNCEVEKIWFIQCKRYKEITKSQIRNAIDDAVKNEIPHKLLLIISCDLSTKTLEYFKEYTSSKYIKEAEIWTATRLEANLYNNNKDLLEKYFGLNLQPLNKNEPSIKTNSKEIDVLSILQFISTSTIMREAIGIADIYHIRGNIEMLEHYNKTDCSLVIEECLRLGIENIEELQNLLQRTEKSNYEFLKLFSIGRAWKASSAFILFMLLIKARREEFDPDYLVANHGLEYLIAKSIIDNAYAIE